jgi:hypothetical protein
MRAEEKQKRFPPKKTEQLFIVTLEGNVLRSNNDSELRSDCTNISENHIAYTCLGLTRYFQKSYQ